MEQLNTFNCSNVLISSFFTDDRGCAHENREHTLIYLCSGELEIEERGKKTLLHPGECAFMRRDNRVWLQKRADKEHPYRSVVLKFTKPFLREFYKTLEEGYSRGIQMRESEPAGAARQPSRHPQPVRVGHSLFRGRSAALRGCTEA